MNIRTMDISDYNKVYALWMSCKNMGFNNLDDSKDGIEKFLKRNPKTSFVAEENDAIVGIILAGHDGRRGYIYHTSVGENHRRQGIGTKLVDKCLSALKEEGINKVALLVFAKNDVGNRFWENQGFIARTDITYKNQETNKLIRIDT